MSRWTTPGPGTRGVTATALKSATSSLLAWIPMQKKKANIKPIRLKMPAFSDVSFSLYTTLIRGDSMGLPEDELQSLTAQPWDDRVCFFESGRDEQGVMSTLLIGHHDLRLGDLHLGGGIHEILKQMPRLGVLVALADATGQQAVQAAGHQRQLEVAVDIHRDGRAQRVHVKEVDPIRDAILDDHPLGVPPDQLGGRLCELVRQQDRRLLMA